MVAGAYLIERATVSRHDEVVHGRRIRVDHFLPRDVGVVVGYPFGQLGSHAVLGDELTW